MFEFIRDVLDLVQEMITDTSSLNAMSKQVMTSLDIKKRLLIREWSHVEVKKGGKKVC